MIECVCSRVLVSGIGVVGAGRIWGSSKGRWNPDKTGIMSQAAVFNAVGFYYLQAVMELVEHHCAVSMVSWGGPYPSL